MVPRAASQGDGDGVTVPALRVNDTKRVLLFQSLNVRLFLLIIKKVKD